MTVLIDLCFELGVLCGECINHTSVSVLLNKCTSCSDANSVLIVLLSKR